LIGQVRGGLSLATTLACALFAAIASSSLPAIITLGKIAIPEMKKYNYSMPMATASLASAGTLGILIPPSNGFIIYSILTQQSIGKLFIAGILPGVLLTILLLITLLIMTTRNPSLAPAGPRTSLKEKIVSLKGTWAVLCLFLLVIGGMYGGIFTATEGGALGAFGAIVISAINKRLNRRNLFVSLLETVRTSGMVLTLIMGGFLLMKFIAVSRLPFTLAEFIQGLNLNRYVIFAFIIFIYILLGMFLDIYGAVVLTVPILYPVVTALGFDPIWYGVIMVLMIEMGLVTPPVGLNVFTLAGITGVPSGEMFKYVWPFVGAMLLCVLMITIFPQIVLFLPSTM
jgi:tripartite ATP-independent transporter DctM subunit